MLAAGNTKLGDGIYSWSIPAITTCPGRSALCESLCYALQGRYHLPTMKDRLAQNHEMSLAENFVPRMLQELKDKQVRVCRVHVSGDFYSVPYTRKWLQIVRQARHVRFYMYTRSHRVPRLRPLIAQLAKRPNCYVWLSWDRNMPPPEPMARTRTCFLASNDYDIPPFPCDLVFRDREVDALKYMDTRWGRVLVCPYEQGVERQVTMTCSRCRICFSPAKESHARARATVGSL